MPPSHHLFEGVLYGSDHQALMLDLLLVEEARRRRRAAGGARGSRGTAQRGGPRQCPVRARGVSLEVGVVAVRLLPQDGGGRRGRVPQDVDDGLQLAGDVVLQQAGGDHGRARPGVPVEQGPVVEHKPFSVLRTQLGKFRIGRNTCRRPYLWSHDMIKYRASRH